MYSEFEVEVLERLDRIEHLATLAAKNTFNLADAAAYTGHTKKYLYKLVRLRLIPHYKSAGGRILYFDRAELDKWLKAHRVPTNEEIEQKAIAYCVNNPRGKKKKTTNAPTLEEEIKRKDAEFEREMRQENIGFTARLKKGGSK